MKWVVILIFSVLEVIEVVKWIAASFCAAAITVISFEMDTDNSLGGLYVIWGVWAVIFLIPTILRMAQAAIWTRGLSQAARDFHLEDLHEAVTKAGEK